MFSLIGRGKISLKNCGLLSHIFVIILLEKARCKDLLLLKVSFGADCQKNKRVVFETYLLSKIRPLHKTGSDERIKGQSRL